MEKKKFPRTDPNTQVHSEFETTTGNSFRAVRNETPATNKIEDDAYDPLNQLPEADAVINEWDMEAEPPKMNAQGKIDRVTLLVGALSLIGLIGVISLVKKAG